MRDLLVNLPAAVAYLNGPDLVFEFTNDAYRQLVGARDLIGLPLREALPDLTRERIENIFRVARTGQPLREHESEVWIRRHGEEPEQLFVDVVHQPVRDEGGHVAGVLLYGSDVTSHVRDRRRLEELTTRLAESEERYRTLFETLPAGVMYYSADGTIAEANPAARRILGFDLSELTKWPLPTAGKAVHEDGSAFALEDFPLVKALRTGDIVADEVMGVPHARTGELRWLRVTAVPDALDTRGRPQRAYAIMADVTEQRRAEAALRQSSRLLGKLRDANVLGVAVAGEAGVWEANDAYLDMIGYTRSDLEAGRIAWRDLTPPEWSASDDECVRQLRRTGACRPYEKEYVHRDGHRVPALVGAAAIGWRPLRWATFVVDLTARQRAEQERAALLAREQAARAQADAAQERLGFLLRAGNLVAATHDPDDLLEQVTRLVVPEIADYCVAFTPTAGGTLAATKLTHRDPARAETLKRLRDHPIPAAGPLISQIAYTTGSTQLASDFSARTPFWVDAAPELMEIVGQARPASALAVPLLADRHALGVLVLGRGGHRPRFVEADATVVEELARRLAAGLANVETFVREHTVAETLQHALLPGALTPTGGLDLAVRYLPASDGVHVGGDWYDAFPLGPDRVGLVIGDVAGHSIGSAAIMGQVRSLLRGYAIDNPSPADVLRRTNTALCQMLPDALATAWYGLLDLPTGDLTYANAGHPTPLVSSSRGRTDYLDAASGTMLGATPGTGFTAAHRRLAPGTRLLLYTDGLIEDRRRDITDGLTALAATIRRFPGRTAEETCQAAQDSLLGSGPRADDVCILSIAIPQGKVTTPRS